MRPISRPWSPAKVLSKVTPHAAECSPLPRPHTYLKRACARRYRYNNVVLVVMFNVAFPGWLDVQKQLRAAYAPLFRQIIYTGFHRQVGLLKSEPCPATAVVFRAFSLKSDHCISRSARVLTLHAAIPDPLSRGMQEGFPEEDTWVSCNGGHHGFFMYQCFSNVLQV